MFKLRKYCFSYLLVCLFLFFNLNSYCQIQSGQVIYNVKINPARIFKTAQLPFQVQKFQNRVDNIIPTLEFMLKFNRNNSLFFINTSLTIDDNDLEKDIALISTRGNNTYFVSLNEKIIIEQTSFLGRDFLIQIPIDALKWKLINEQRKIGSYICYKAEAIRENSGPLKKEDKYSTYTVWYCPVISFNHGPFEISGLPGLVLEFSNGQLTYTASEIKLNQSDLKIEKPTKGEIITKKEFENLGKTIAEDNGFIRN